MPAAAALSVAVALLSNAAPVRAGYSTAFSPRQVEHLSAGVDFSTGLAYTSRSLRESVNVATVDPRSAVRVQPILSNDMIVGRERPSKMAARYSTPGSPALVAINGDFWWPGHGTAPRGLHVQNREVMSAGPLALPTLGIKGNADMRMDQVKLNVSVSYPGGNLNVSQVNGGRRPGELALYTPRVGSSTHTDALGTEVVLSVNGVLRPQSSLTGTVQQVRVGAGNSAVGPGQMVLSGSDVNSVALQAMQPGQSVTINSTMSNSSWNDIDNAIGGDQFLVRNGRLSALVSRAHPRTAIGLTKSGSLLMVTVDGRQPGYSYGVTAPEMGELMMQLGAVDALNFDGGGSTTMAVRAPGATGLIVANSPSGGYQRAVTSALVVFATSAGAAATANPDTTPPTTPGGFDAAALAYRRVMLQWDDARDDTTSELRFYVYRDGRKVGTAVRTAYVDRPRTVGTHRYTVRAVDAAGNISGVSVAITVVTRYR